MAGNSELAAAIIASANRLGIHPSDLATAISYETAGTFDPWAKGPTTQWGQHRGLIQWGEPQRQKYGVTEGMPVAAQLEAAEKYLTDAGVKPGMGLLDIYSAINAGRVGRYGASDANNGGAPGTVADKVATQMVGHRLKANQLLGLPGSNTPAAPMAVASAPTAATASPAPLTTDNPAAALDTSQATLDLQPLLAMAQKALAEAEQPTRLKAPAPLPDLQQQRRARMIAAALRRSREA